MKVLRKSATGLLGLIIAVSLGSTDCYSKSRKRAAGTDATIMNKLFPRSKKVELDLNAGVILNQSYIETGILQGQLSYYTSESWAFGIEGFFAINQDKDERACIETFINDPSDEVGSVCNPLDETGVFPEGSRANYGPAYVPIRELNIAAAAMAIWTPVYAKQLIFLSFTTYFDLYLPLGAGIVTSTFYPQQTTLRNGKPARGVFAPEDTETIGVSEGESDEYGLLYGPEGRPDPVDELHPMVTFGIGQKYHFLKNWNFKIELRNYTLVGTDAGFDLFFTLTGGLGFRF